MNSNERHINKYAQNTKLEYLHISQATNGRHKYYCLGCNKEMIAVFYTKTNKENHFRHYVKPGSSEEDKCHFSSSNSVEIIVSDILQRTKTIKVPKLYKYPPVGVAGKPIILKDSEYINAATVKSQVTIYEDNDGNINWGINPKISDRYLQIKPDLTFFDANGYPSLLIEIRTTHKVDDEKLAKIFRLGINTIEVSIPKTTPEKIEKLLGQTSNKKWLFNEEEQGSEYIQLSKGDNDRIYEFDELDGILHEESVRCRKARLSNLIRSIKGCLGTQSYKHAEFKLESEISRVEDNTRKIEKEEKELEAEHYRQVKLLRESIREIGNIESTKGRIKEETEGIINRITEVIKARERVEERVFRELREEAESNPKELSSRIKSILEAWRVVGIYPDAKCENEKYRRAYELFKAGTWKTWKDT